MTKNDVVEEREEGGVSQIISELVVSYCASPIFVSLPYFT
jgi:hypothetical protein